MATKKDTARSRINSIKTHLRSISTCTATIAPDLQHLLAEQCEEPIQKENLRVKSTQSTTRRKATKTTITAAVDAVKQPSDSLAPREKYILATEVVNIVLKSLADALKAQPSPQILGKRSKSKSPTSDDTHTPAKQHTTHSRPLQERSISQTINSPQKASLLRRSTSYSSFLTTGPDPGLLATADCARIAFSYLRTPEAVKTAGKDSPELQLENGILAFIGKLVAHNLDNLAVKELRVLKRRLDHYLGNGIDDGNREARRTNGKVEPKKAPVPTEKETLASMLDFGDVDRKSAALPLITSHQIYTLRILARISRPRIIEAAWETLQISNQSSPVNLIWHTAKTPSFQVKATRQLESLAQIILSLCPSVSSADDATSGEEQLQPSPDIVFRLQHLAFQIRKKWWSLAKHQGNEEKELFEPFSKCVIAFARRSKISAVKKYKTAEALYTDLCGAVDNPLSSTKHSVSVEQAAKSLSSLAQAAGLTEDALRWLGAPASPDKSKASAAKTATRMVRILTLSLDAATKDATRPDLEDNVANTIDALSGSLSGSALELDSLFLEINTLRRMASRILSSTAAVASTKSEPKIVQTQITRIIAACVHFSARYLGTKPPVDVDTKVLIQYNERAFKVSKFAKNIIDSVITCCKQPIDSDASWNELSTVIQDCVRILHHFGKDLPEDLQGSFVKISNAYWAVSLRLRNADGNPEFILEAMERSIDLLQTRTQQERQSGLLAMKLEKLGEALDYLDRNDSSRDAFFRCAENLLSNCALEELIETAAKQPIQDVFQKASEAGTLGRVLKSYHRSFIKDGIEDSIDLAFYDNSGLPNAARGALLEWQLILYIKSLSRNRPWNFVLISSIQEISKRLLQVYSPSEFPIRRQRAHLLLLQLSQEHPDILTSETLQSSLNINLDAAQSPSQDSKLTKYGPHFETLLKFKTFMQETVPPMSTLQECLSIWQTLVASTSSWKDLTEQVDDPDNWIQELQAVADYLAAKGEEYVCLPALHLLVTVLELEKSSDPSRLVTARCTLGHQLLQLGYTGKAGLSFAKAEDLVKNEATTTDAKLRWHISYAEYLLRIGHITKWQEQHSFTPTISNKPLVKVSYPRQRCLQKQMPIL
jgi:separase